MHLSKMFGTDIGWGVDGITNQPYQIAQKFLEGRNQFFQKIVSVKTIEPPFSVVTFRKGKQSMGKCRGILAEPIQYSKPKIEPIS